MAYVKQETDLISKILALTSDLAHYSSLIPHPLLFIPHPSSIESLQIIVGDRS
jgi:hypothetical protein